METNEILSLWALAGVSTLQVLNITEALNRPLPDRPNFRSWVFWLPFIFYLALAPVLVSLLHDQIGGKALAAFTMGLTVPSVIKGLAKI